MSMIKKPHELEIPQTVKILVYGQPGICKTTLALSAPDPLLLDFDGGVHRIRPQDMTDTVQVRSWEDVGKALAEDLTPFKTLVVDTVGKMLDYMSLDIVSKDPKMGRRDGALTLQGFGARKAMFQRFVGMVSTLGKHLVFVAHDKEERNGDDKIIRPDIGGSSSGDLIKEIDLVGYIEAIDKNRTISFDPCEKFYGKNTCGLDPKIQLPGLSNLPNRFFQTVLEKFAATAEIRKAQVQRYNAMMDGIRKGIDAVVETESANQFMEWASTAEHIWDSRFQAAQMLKARTAELGLTFNKVSKQYEETNKAAHAAA